MAAYKIGNFTFDTEEEYARGLEDAKKIEKIQNTVDLNEPETALRLYWLIRTGKIKFGSKVGKKFFLDIADVVAKSAAKNITQAQAPEQQAGEEPRQVAQDRSRKILGAVCVTAAILCFGWYFWSDYTNHRGSQANEYLKMLKENPTEAAEMVDNDTFFSEDAPELAAGLDQTERENEPPPPVLPEYEAIVAQHSDFAGWITIDGTKIDYPVIIIILVITLSRLPDQVRLYHLSRIIIPIKRSHRTIRPHRQCLTKIRYIIISRRWRRINIDITRIIQTISAYCSIFSILTRWQAFRYIFLYCHISC